MAGPRPEHVPNRLHGSRLLDEIPNALSDFSGAVVNGLLQVEDDCLPAQIAGDLVWRGHHNSRG